MADWLVPENPSRLIYGMIAIGALLAAESGRHESYADTIGSAVIAALLYWLVHAYSDVLGERLVAAKRLTARRLGRALAAEWSIVKGAMIPLSALVVAWALGADQETALNIAIWLAIASVILFELAAGVRSRATPAELALDVCVGAAMGFAIFSLKIVLH